MRVWDWLWEIYTAVRVTPEFLIYLFSFLGLALLPNHLGKKAWGILVWFFSLNVILVFLHNRLNAWESVVLFAALSQTPWIWILADLFSNGKMTQPLLTTPVREFLLWHVTRIMGFHFILGVLAGRLPVSFGMETGMGETLTGLGALILYVWYRPDKYWFRLLVIFWNAYGLTSVTMANFKIFFSNPSLPRSLYPSEIFQYLYSFPQTWIFFFWFPLSISMHLTLFYKLYKNRIIGFTEVEKA